MQTTAQLHQHARNEMLRIAQLPTVAQRVKAYAALLDSNTVAYKLTPYYKMV
jgi:hypothetical protein